MCQMTAKLSWMKLVCLGNIFKCFWITNYSKIKMRILKNLNGVLQTSF